MPFEHYIVLVRDDEWYILVYSEVKAECDTSINHHLPTWSSHKAQTSNSTSPDDTKLGVMAEVMRHQHPLSDMLRQGSFGLEIIFRKFYCIIYLFKI